MFQASASKIRGKMAENGYTITSLAQKMHISRSTMSKYLSFPGKMPVEKFMEMANILFNEIGELTDIFLPKNLS